jgi:membrane protease YdiL (CAAX protease family)
VTSHDPAWPDPGPGRGHAVADPPDAFPVPFSVFDALALVVWAQVAQVLVAVPVQAAGVDLSGGLGVSLTIVLIQLVTLAGVVGFLRWRGAWSWRLLGPVRPERRHLGVGLAVGVVGFVVVTLLMELATRALGPVAPPEQSLMAASRAGGLGAVVAGVSVVLVAPVVEELIYRSALFQSLRKTLGLWPGMLISAGVFAVVHVELGQPLYLLGLFVLGMWFAAAFHRTGSILVPVVGHATFNATSLLIAAVAT